jgi:hypothetical protein
MVNGATGVVENSTSVTIPPGATGSAFLNPAPPPNGQSYCRVSGISKSKARVTHCALNLAETACESTVTVP